MGILERRASARTHAEAGEGDEAEPPPPEMNIRLLARSVECIGTKSPARTFKYFHFNGVHPPFILNENCGYEPMPQTGESYARQAEGVLRIVENFLDLLKKNNVYDNSLVLILGDHGVGYPFPLSPDMLERCARPEGAGAKGLLSRVWSRMFGRARSWKGGASAKAGTVPLHIMARGSPLLLVKPPRSAGRMRISDAPVCLSDIPATVVSVLGLRPDFPGRSVFSVAESEKRARKYYHWFPGNRWEKGFAPPLREYAVNGFAWCPDSWSATGFLLSPGKGRIPYEGGDPVTAP
jgi:hypothetical protein